MRCRSSSRPRTKDQAETDHYYDNLLQGGGREHACGWVQDRFGLSWQITPNRLMELISDPDKAKAGRVMGAMMTMKKIDIGALEAAASA
jgi:predicted 3-demethylubiquinone-9 3-methyltransferase (glyoxalase superfamily)